MIEQSTADRGDAEDSAQASPDPVPGTISAGTLRFMALSVFRVFGSTGFTARPPSTDPKISTSY